MQYNPGPAGRRPLQDEVTVHIPDEVTVHLPDGPNGAKPPDGVTVLVPGAMLAPAPTPEAGNAGSLGLLAGMRARGVGKGSPGAGV